MKLSNICNFYVSGDLREIQLIISRVKKEDRNFTTGY